MMRATIVLSKTNNMACSELPSVSFGVRTFTKKISFSNEDHSVYVSAIGPSLFCVPVCDVDWSIRSLSSKSMRRLRIKVFNRGIGINIKGISKFTDSDHVIVFSSHYLAVVDPEEFQFILQNEKGTANVTTICTKQIIKVPNNWEIIDLQCMDKGKMLIVCATRLLIARIRWKDGDDHFILDVGKPKDRITTDELGTYGLPHRSLKTIRACSIISDPYKERWVLCLCGQNGKDVVYRPFGNCHVDLLAFPDASNTVVALGNKNGEIIGRLSNTHCAVVQMGNNGFKAQFALPSFYNKNFIMGERFGFMQPGKGSLFYHGLRETKLVNILRTDLLISDCVSCLEKDDNKMIFSGLESTWGCVKIVRSITQRDLTLSSPKGSSLVFPFANGIFQLTYDNILHGYSFVNGQLVEGIIVNDSLRHFNSGSHQSIDIRVADNVQPPTFLISSYENMWTLSMEDTVISLLCTQNLGPNHWTTSLEEDKLAIADSIGLVILLINSSKHPFVSTSIGSFLDFPLNRDDLNKNFLVRKWKSRGGVSVVIIAYKEKLAYFAYKNDPKICKGHQLTNLLEKTVLPFSDSIPISDMLVERDVLSLLYRNGTIVQYKLGVESDCGTGIRIQWTLLEFRRVDVIGLHLIQSPQGLRVIGLVNNYMKDSIYRTCEDDVKKIDKVIASSRTGEECPLAALVDPYTGFVLCGFPKWNADHLKTAFLPDFPSSLIHVMVVLTEAKHGKNGMFEYTCPIERFVSLNNPNRPPGTFKGMTSTRIDERFFLVAMSFLNLHLYLLDTVTGSLEECGVFGWDRDISAPTITKSDGEVCFVTVHSSNMVTYLFVKMEKRGDSYNVTTMYPMVRGLVPTDQYPQYTIKGFRSGSESYIGQIEEEDGKGEKKEEDILGAKSSLNVILFEFKKGTQWFEAYVCITPCLHGNVPIIACTEQLQLPRATSDTLREYIHIRGEEGIIVVETCKKGLMFRYGDNTRIDAVPSPIRCLSPIFFLRLFPSPLESGGVGHQIVGIASVDRIHRVWIHLMCIDEHNNWDRYKHPTPIPFFDKTTLPAKLFVREVYRDYCIYVYVYRLIEGTNYLEAAMIDCVATWNSEESLDCLPLPRVFLEMDGVTNLETFDIHFVNGEFLFANDGPRMIRVCKCCRSHFTKFPGEFTEEEQKEARELWESHYHR